MDRRIEIACFICSGDDGAAVSEEVDLVIFGSAGVQLDTSLVSVVVYVLAVLLPSLRKVGVDSEDWSFSSDPRNNGGKLKWEMTVQYTRVQYLPDR